ncbi:MAG TPA: F0F1 ATP synthase subunit delta [Candidatus Limnocylindria bacterium]|jgi:F-type H+-transporting ATPase subunit delta|nr:F0F1 ATP synthase subunit delta [Candidatus Limnocylindria bacterium]
MKSGKQTRRDAKSLYQACKVNGLLDEQKVRQVVNQVLAQKPRGYLSVLDHFQRLVRLDVARRTARVENAVQSTPELIASINANLTARYGPGLSTTFWVNPELIGGLKIRVGSDIYDGSVSARLAALEASF